MHIHLLPVYSKYAAPDLLARVLRGRTLPEGMRLSEHQALTLEALETPGIQVVLNTAMTGDGKSLAGYLPALLPGADRATILALYPTIELSKDQTSQFERYRRDFEARLRFDTLWGDKLTELAGPGRDGRAGALMEKLTHHEVLLTNPDIFIRMLNYQYRPGVFTAQEILYRVLTNFTLLLFDEFHLFSMPQFAAAAAALVYAQEYDPNHPPRALFSSATQHRSLLQLIKRAGLRTREIRGAYAPAGADPASLAGEYRQILYPADLHLHQLTGEQTIERWLREHLDVLTSAWQDGRSARAAIIVSSIASAHRIAQWLKAELGAHPGKPGGWSVEEVTGLSHGSLKADIVVGTSTIDVGIDFDINLLIFEALNAGQFLQRLGRLGRVHQGSALFPAYTAHALISAKTPWVSARLIEAFKQAGVEDGDPVDRPTTLRAAVEDSYPSEADFAPYVRRWAALQGYHIVHSLREQRDSRKEESPYTSIADPLEGRYAQLYGLNTMRSLTGRYFRLSKHSGKDGQLQLEEILSFRGSSPFQVCLWDPTRAGSSDEFQTYDLLSLLKMAEWAFVSYQDFETRLRAACASEEEFDTRRREFAWSLRDQHKQPLCLRVIDYLEERERLLLSQQEDLDDLGALDQAVVLKGFRVEEPRNNHALGEINRVLHRQDVVCYVTRAPAADLFRRYRLPALFPLYSLNVTGIRERCTVAFGKSALMLEALIRSRRRPQSDQSPIIC
jgi:CRISPR-associated endonuclease/helicase Cas3